MAAISSAPPPRAASKPDAAPVTRRRKRARSSQSAWRAFLVLLLVACDMLALNATFVGVYLWQFNDIRASGLSLPESPRSLLLAGVLFNLVFLLTFAVNRLYELRRGASRVDEAYKVFTAVSLATVLSFVVNTLLPELGFADLAITRQVLVYSWVLAIVSIILLRFWHRSLVVALRARGIDTRRVLIVGAREPGVAIWRTIRRTPALGYQVQGFLSDSCPVGTVVDGLPVLGRTSQIERAVRITNADEVLIALSGRSKGDLLDLVALAEDESVAIKVYPDTFQLITNNEVSIGDLSGLPLVSVKNAALDRPWNRALKRGLDLLTSITVLVLAAPLMLLIALLIKLESRGPIFFLQERVGLDSRPFWMIKFRTMRIDAEDRGPGWTVANDPRVTRLGRFLRRTSLDELPQFINVLIGEMSVVGPRPEQSRWVEQFRQQIPRYMRRHKEKAGITGWAQVNGLRGDTSIEERTRYDLYYIENWSLLFDVKIIVRTLADFLTGKQDNAY